MIDGNYIGRNGKRYMRRDGLWYPSWGGAPWALSDEEMVKLYKVTLDEVKSFNPVPTPPHLAAQSGFSATRKMAERDFQKIARAGVPGTLKAVQAQIGHEHRQAIAKDKDIIQGIRAVGGIKFPGGMTKEEWRNTLPRALRAKKTGGLPADEWAQQLSDGGYIRDASVDSLYDFLNRTYQAAYSRPSLPPPKQLRREARKIVDERAGRLAREVTGIARQQGEASCEAQRKGNPMRFKKGSPEARAFMAKLRAMQGKRKRNIWPFSKKSVGPIKEKRMYPHPFISGGPPITQQQRYRYRKYKYDIGLSKEEALRRAISHGQRENPPLLILGAHAPIGNPHPGKHRRQDPTEGYPHLREKHKWKPPSSRSRREKTAGKQVATVWTRKVNPTPAARRFIGKKIKRLVREGYLQRQSIAIAHSMARKKGYRSVPKFKRNHGRFGDAPKGFPEKLWNDPAFQAERRVFIHRHGDVPIHVSRVNVPSGSPKFMTAYGTSHAAFYDAPKQSRRGGFKHPFGKKKPFLVSSAQKGPKWLGFAGGSFRAGKKWLHD